MALPEIKVKIGADTSGLERGLAAATANLTKFAKRAGTAVAIAGAGAAAGLIALTKAAIDNADALDNMSQRLGVSVEALSRLQYAAKLSDTSIESLQTGFRTLANNMVAGADAFAQLGINVANADGSMRSSVDVFSDVADRFASMEDGALKSSIAVDLFGRSGLDLIPMLNAGSAGLAEFGRQSDAVGNTLTTNTATAAAKFNDTIDRINLKLGGVVNKIMEAALPALQRLADKIASPEFAEAAANFGVAIVDQLSAIIDWLVKVEERWAKFVDFINTQGRPKVFPVGSTNIENRATPGWMDRNRAAGSMLDATFAALGGNKTFGSTDEMFKSLNPPSKLGGGGGGGGDGTSELDAERERIAARLAVIQEGFLTEAEMRDAKYADDRAALQSAFALGLSDEEQYRKNVEALEKEHQDQLAAIRNAALYENLDAAASIGNSIVSIMKSTGDKQIALQKGISSASVAMSTAVGIMKAFEKPFPINVAEAASVAAQGMAQLASINSASASGANSAGVKGSSASAAEPAMNRTLTVQGITAGQIFSGDSMRDFMEQMLQMQRDGYQVVLA
jgi:hypothetical protein